MMIEPNATLLFIGDSVTDCGRDRVRPEGFYGKLGTSYVDQVNTMLAYHYPKQHVRILNYGISGNTVKDLERRWEEDVLALNPDYVVILIGINDVWRHFDAPFETYRHITLNDFRATYLDLINRTKERVKGMILMTPFYIEANREDPMRKQMEDYAEVVRTLSQQYQLPLVDLQYAYDEMMKHYPTQLLSKDRVHPNNLGHYVIAQAFLKEIESLE